MIPNIIEQAKRGLEGFAIGGYHTSGNFSKYHAEYYKYLGHQDLETRNMRLSHLLVCWGLEKRATVKFFSQ